MSGQMFFVVAAYGFAAAVIIAVCLDSYLRWRRVKADYQRLFARKDKTDA